MVTIERKDDNFIFEVKGLHKLWALKSQLVIPSTNVVGAYPNDKNLNHMLGFRMPGTHIPGLIAAGTFIIKEGTIFCDVVDHTKSIVVELQDEDYKKLIVEVENPSEAIALLTK